jgi:hypothetical protein
LTYFIDVDLKGDFVPEPFKSAFMNIVYEKQPMIVANIRKVVTGKD